VFKDIMKIKIISSIFILVVVAIGLGCEKSDPRLSGKWRSNLELTREYYEKHAILTEKQKNVFSQLFGKMEVDYFTPGKCKIFLPEDTIDTGGKKIESDDYTEILEYKIIYQNKISVVMVYDDQLEGEKARTLYFIDEKTYWIYVGDSNLTDINIREYFTKIE
jgi:hypothetical protein